MSDHVEGVVGIGLIVMHILTGFNPRLSMSSAFLRMFSCLIAS